MAGEKTQFLKLSTAPVEPEEAMMRSFEAITEFFEQLTPLDQAVCAEDLARLIENRIAILGSFVARNSQDI